jgi:hypothetical protein
MMLTIRRGTGTLWLVVAAAVFLTLALWKRPPEPSQSVQVLRRASDLDNATILSQEVGEARFTGGKANVQPPRSVGAKVVNVVSEDSSLGPIREEVIDQWLKRASKDPSGTLDQILLLPDAAERNELLDWILSAWTSEDRDPALEWMARTVRRLPREHAVAVLDVLIGAWALEDAPSSLEWSERRLDEPARSLALRTIASCWGLANPETLEAWLLAQAKPALFWVEELIQGWIHTDPKKAMEWSLRLEDPSAVSASRQNVIQSWLLTDVEAAKRYLQQNPSLIPETVPVASGSR